MSRNDTGMPVAFDTWAMSSISPSVTAASSPVSPVGTTSNSPPPASTTAWARPVSSSADAKVPGTSSPSRDVWFSDREVEKPTAPASMAARTWVAISAMSAAVASSLFAPAPP